MTRRRVLVAIGVCVLVPALAVAVFAARYRPKWEREDPATVQRETAQLRQERDSLRALVYDAAATSDLLDEQPAGDVVIGLPTPLVDLVVRNVVTGWFHDVDVRLPRLQVRKSGEVKAKLGIFGRRTVGEFHLDMVLDDVRGRLQPGVPEMTFGGDVVRLAIPVKVAAGTGIARITADWKSRGLAGSVCRDETVRRDVTGQVRAREYMARGRLNLTAVDGAIMADPDFPELAIRIYVDPSRASVAALDSLMAEKDGLCGYAVDKARASERIQALVGRGFRVKIPQRFFRPIRLPVAVATSVPVQDRAVGLAVTASGLAVTPSVMWVGANVTVIRQAVPPPAAHP
jgi:hypothetical protein